jgi:hypothetical protein
VRPRMLFALPGRRDSAGIACGATMIDQPPSPPSAADVTDIAALQNSESCDPPCGAPVPVCCRLDIPVLRSLSPNEGHTAPSTDDALLDQALGSR